LLFRILRKYFCFHEACHTIRGVEGTCQKAKKDGVRLKGPGYGAVRPPHTVHG